VRNVIRQLNALEDEVSKRAVRQVARYDLKKGINY
jgi:hypothetical protein